MIIKYSGNGGNKKKDLHLYKKLLCLDPEIIFFRKEQRGNGGRKENKGTQRTVPRHIVLATVIMQ